MSNFIITIAPGSTVESGGRHYEITRLLDLEAVLAKDKESGRLERLLLKDISLKNNETGSKPHSEQELILISEEDWQEAQRRFTHLRPLIVASRRTRAMVEEAAYALGVHPGTIYRLIKAYESTERISSLIPSKPDGGRGQTRLEPQVVSRA